MSRTAIVTFEAEKTKQAYESLRQGKFEEQQLHTAISKAITALKTNPASGTKIPKRLWPKEYAKYEITNLWKYDLPDGARLIYTIYTDETTIASAIIEWFGHKEYEKRFNY